MKCAIGGLNGWDVPPGLDRSMSLRDHRMNQRNKYNAIVCVRKLGAHLLHCDHRLEQRCRSLASSPASARPQPTSPPCHSSLTLTDRSRCFCRRVCSTLRARLSRCEFNLNLRSRSSLVCGHAQTLHLKQHGKAAENIIQISVAGRAMCT